MVAEVCEQEMAKVESELDQLEAEINPALDDNALVALSYVLGTVVDAMKQVPEVSHANLAKSFQIMHAYSTDLAISSACVIKKNS